MAAYLRLLRDAKLLASTSLSSLEVADLTAQIATEDLTLHKVGFVNVNHLSHDKWKILQPYFASVDILFLIECWTIPPDFPGFTKYVDTTVYYNTVYVKSNKDVHIELVDFGFRIAGDTILYCLYLPPNKRNYKLPDGYIIGDLNWVSNRLIEPHSYETSNLYHGMCSYGIKASFSHLDWTDHDYGEILWDEHARVPYDIDQQRVTNAVIKASNNGVLKVPIKRRDRRLRNQNMNFRCRLYTSNTKKIFNANIISKQMMDPWLKILNHQDNKPYKPLIGNVNPDKCIKLKTRARDICGLNANIIITIWRNMSMRRKENILKSLKKFNVIKGLMLKKKEFVETKFNIKDFRIISIMPTFVKLYESCLNFNVLDQYLVDSIVGFRPKRAVTDFIKFISQAVT